MMDIEYAKGLTYSSIRKQYKSYLQSLELGRNTVGTVTGDTFYLWNNVSQLSEIFAFEEKQTKLLQQEE